MKAQEGIPVVGDEPIVPELLGHHCKNLIGGAGDERISF
jgi:hypothetical protein